METPLRKKFGRNRQTRLVEISGAEAWECHPGLGSKPQTPGTEGEHTSRCCCPRDALL